MTDDKMLARIGALLRQAEGTDNAHEAEAFMAAAQRLATATSIDLAVARSHTRTTAQDPVQRTITIGNAGAKGLRTYVQLFAVIAAANDVKVDVASNSTFVYAYGFPEDIDASHALYASLVMQMVRASEAYLTSGRHRPTPTITARLNFQLAFGARIGQRLAQARDEAREEVRARSKSVPGTAIALRNKELELQDFYSRESKARGTWQAHRATAGYSSAARRAGDRAGRSARLGNSPELSNGASRAREVSARDTQRGKVYAAEQFVRTLFDRAAEHGSRVVDFFGTPLTLPPEGRFASVESVQRYVDSVLNHPSVQRQWPALTPISVRPRRGVTAAHYERHDGAAVIAVPARHDRWALRELVVLHEIAHHACDVPPPHGPEFVATFTELAGVVMGPEVEHVLRVVYLKEGVG